MALTQDQAKIALQILNSLRYLPQDGVIIYEIITELEKIIIDKNINVPNVTIIPDNVNVKIVKK